MQHQEIEELLGAYALDAVAPEESEAIASHLATCPRCRAEVQSHREVAGLLGYAGGSAPEGLWDRIVVGLEEPPPPLDLQRVTALRPLPEPATARRLRSWQVIAPMLVAAAAAVVVIAVLAVRVGHLDGRVHSLSSALSSASASTQLSAAIMDPSHITIALAPKSGETVSGQVVAIPRAAGTYTAFWTPSQMAVLPANETYQMWALVSGEPVSLGVMGSRPDQVWIFQLQRGMHELMVTVEPRGGVSSPTTNVLLEGVLPPAI
jgi:anti-sigma factor RsiW